jgi:hypothetical protein
MRPRNRQGGYIPLTNVPPGSEPKDRDRGNAERLKGSDAFNSHDGSSLPTLADLKLNKFGNDYKDGPHWTSVLDRATSSSGQDVELDDAQIRDAQLPIYQTVLLFDCGRKASEKELIAGLPSRKTCDELVSSYFQLLGHSCKTTMPPSCSCYRMVC